MVTQRLFRTATLFLMCDFYAFGIAVPACGSSGNTLADYVTLGSCVDTAGIELQDFSFSVVSSGGGATPINAGNITVQLWPGLTSGGVGDTDGVEFVFDNQGVSGAGFVDYQIGFTFDASGSLRDILDPGTVDINTSLCIGSAFIGGVCPVGSTLENANVFEGATSQLVDTIPGSVNSTIWGIQDNISLNANGGTAGFYAIENDMVPSPEPVSAILAISGLAAILLRRRKRLLTVS
jgi:hypothetical protein